MELEEALSALGRSTVPVALDVIEAGVFTRIEAATVRRQSRLALVAVMTAAGMVGITGASLPADRSSGSEPHDFAPLALAPSTLLEGDG